MISPSIIVPAFNEEKRIRQALSELINEFKDAQIIVVSDGSTDKTEDIVGEFENVELIKSHVTCGKGASIIKGFRFAKRDVLGFLDADGSFKPAQVRKLLNQMGESDCVIASKWIGASFCDVDESILRKLTGRVWNLFVNILLGLKIKDTQAGAKFLTKNAFQKIECDFVSSGFEFDVELLYRLKKYDFNIMEIHTPFTNISESTFKYDKTPRMLWNLFKIRFNSKF